MKPIALPAALLSLLAIGGCASGFMGSSPSAPLVAGASTYQTQTEGQIIPQALWYRNFEDPALNTLIDEGFSANLTLAQALARFEAARAQSTISGVSMLPKVDANADSGKRWEEGDGQDLTSSFGAAMEWEVDLFGRLSSAAKSDKLDAVAAAEDIETVRLALAADIAVAYYSAVAANRTLALLEAQEKIDGELLSLVSLREQEGLGTRVEILQQQSQQALNQSLIPVAESALRGFENRLDVLTGKMPDNADVTKKDSAFPPAALIPPLGVPSDLLLNRPDLRAERARLAAIDADIDAAIAERLPRVTLNGSYLLAAGGGAASPVIALLGGLVQPLLDWGSRQAEVSRNKALYQEQLAAFSQLYLEAVEDVETTLYQIVKQKEYVARLDGRRKILAETVDKTRAVYQEGLSDYLPVLNSLQDLRAVERTVLEEERDLALLHIQLYRALGGTALQKDALR